MVSNMATTTVVLLYYCCCFAGAVTAVLSEVAVQGHPSPQNLNAPSRFQFGVHKGLISRRLLPLGSTYSRAGLHFPKGLTWPPPESDQLRTSLRQDDHHHYGSNIIDSRSASNSQSFKEKIEFQLLEVSMKAASSGDGSYSSEDGGGGTRGHGGDGAKREVVIGMAIAIPLLLVAILAAWLWYKFRYQPKSQAPPSLLRDRRSVPKLGEVATEADCYSNSLSNISRLQLLGSWLTNSFSGNQNRRRRRQVVWLSSACEMHYSKLQAATSNFSSNNLLGEGGTSRVYRAKLDDDTVGAVKRLDTLRNRRLTESQFQSEVELMRQVRHPNLVSLLGFCKHGDQRLLVYELMKNGSLDDQLYGPTKGSALTWNLRIKIALESARGLEYLHEHCVPPVVHRDLKASNILLDANFNAKISDFGLATPLEGLTHEESLQLIGTVGYVAPEFFETGALTEKSDVYAFGVVLLELLTGRKPIDHALPPEEHSLVKWTRPQLTDRRRLPHIVAPNLRSHLNLKHLYQVAAVAALCVCEEPSYRPLIADVVQSLVPLVPVELGGALRSSQAHNPRSPAPGSGDHTPKRLKSGSRSFTRSLSQEKPGT